MAPVARCGRTASACARGWRPGSAGRSPSIRRPCPTRTRCAARMARLTGRSNLPGSRWRLYTTLRSVLLGLSPRIGPESRYGRFGELFAYKRQVYSPPSSHSPNRLIRRPCRAQTRSAATRGRLGSPGRASGSRWRSKTTMAIGPDRLSPRKGTWRPLEPLTVYILPILPSAPHATG